MNYPLAIKTEDGYTLRRQEDGSYTNGDLTFNSLDEIEVDYTIIEPMPKYDYTVGTKAWCQGEPVVIDKVKTNSLSHNQYKLITPGGHKFAEGAYISEDQLEFQHTPDIDSLDIGQQIIYRGNTSKILGKQTWTRNTMIYAIYTGKSQGQTKEVTWVSRSRISRFDTKQDSDRSNPNIHPLGSVFCEDTNKINPGDAGSSWVQNHGVVETHEGPGLKYWIEYQENYYQVDHNDLTTNVHWDTKFKVGDFVEYKNDVWKISSYVNTRRYNDGKSAGESVIYKLLQTKGKRAITKTAFEGELQDHIPKFNNGDRVRVSDESIISSIIKGKYGFIMSQVSKSAYQIAFPAGQAEKGTAKFARTEVVAAKFLTLEEK